MSNQIASDCNLNKSMYVFESENMNRNYEQKHSFRRQN